MDSIVGMDSSIFEGIGHYLQEFDQIRQSTGCSALGEEANGTNTIEIAMARLEDEFRYILAAYTCSNSNLTDNESFTDSSSSTLSQFSFNISISATENKVSDAPAEEHRLLKENQEVGKSHGHQTLNFPSIISIHELAVIPIQSEAIYYLRRIAERMIASGSTQECVQAYCSIRRPMMDAIFLKLGTEALTTRQVQMLEWDGMEKKIKRWIHAARICFGMLFVNEKMLLDRIFQGPSLGNTAVYEACFSETVMCPATQLFSFAEVVSTASSRSPERLFKVLDIYEALSSLLPAIEITFVGRHFESIRGQAIEILSKLADMGRGIILGFEKSLLHEISKKPMPGGEIHPLNRYVMNYMILIASYKQLLVELIVSNPAPLELENISGDLDMDFVVVEGKSPLALHLNLILGILLFNLEDKSKRYEKNASLAHLFMLNNVHYMFQKIDGSLELREAFEDDNCLRKLKEKIRLAAMNYLMSAWGRVLHCLREEGTWVKVTFSSGVSKNVLRKRFKKFNDTFEEVCRNHATWLVPHVQLREELLIFVSGKLIPAYRSFLDNIRSHIENGKQQENYMKHSVLDIENAIWNLFEGDIPRKRYNAYKCSDFSPAIVPVLWE